MMLAKSRSQHRVFILLSLSLFITIACLCGGGNESEPQSLSLVEFEESDLIGIWEAHYSYMYGTEILVFKEDGTYLQIYEDLNGYLYVSPLGKWDIDRRTDGRIWIHLEGGRWFPHGAEVAELEGKDHANPGGGVHDFFDHTTNTPLTMLGKLILYVEPRSNSKGFVLIHFAYDIDDSGPQQFEPIESRP